MSLSVGNLSERYMNTVAPGDGMKFMRLLNEAEERLAETGRWHWTKALVELTVEDGGRVRIDPTVHRALLGCTIDGGATVIQTRDIEFVPGGPGRNDPADGTAGYMVDEGLVTVTLDAGPPPVTGVRRSYKIMPLVDDGDTVEALVHKAHAEVTADIGSVTTCPSAGALKLAMLAIVYEEANDFERSKSYWNEAFARLDGDEKTNRGGARVAAVYQPYGAGISPVHNII